MLSFLQDLRYFVDGVVELTQNPLNVGCLKGGNRISSAVDDSSMKTFHGIIGFDSGTVSFVFHHGLTLGL